MDPSAFATVAEPSPGLLDTPPPARSLDRTRLAPSPVATRMRPPVDRPTDLPAESSEGTDPAPDDPRVHRFPVVGDEFLGFKLVDELGTGAFARVFLAEQVGLADRPVALKVTTRPTREPQRLAKLRHTNVVPIYSVHDEPPLQAVCMPFLGRQTLADLLREYRTTGVFPGTVAHSTEGLAQRTTVGSSHRSGAPAAPAAVPAPAAPVPLRSGTEHVELVLRLVTRMGEGLAHAHEVGILHLDLKPANVLLADDGQPLLLDFNLSYDVKANDRDKAGGTLPYMAPEQLDEYRTRTASGVDHRSDLYALGVIAFELLTGRHPFAGGARQNPAEMAEQRRAGAPSPRAVNPSISPAVDSIVRKLLDPVPDRRYQAARDVLADLDRHRHHLPLRFAPDRSVLERARKWRRRNPRVAIYLALAGAVLCSGGLGAAAYTADQDRSRAAAVRKTREAGAELAGLRVDLVSRSDPKRRAAGLERGRAVLAGYGLPGDRAWADRPEVRLLPESQRAALADDLGELALLMAHAEWLAGRGKPAAERDEATAQALFWNRVAEGCYAGRPAPDAVAAQRKRLTGEDDQALPAGDTRADLYLRAALLMAAGRFNVAAAPLERLTARDPAHFAGQFELAVCRREQGKPDGAAERYKLAQALAPRDPRPAYNLGADLLYHRKYREAEVHLTDAIDRDPTFADAYLDRAIARTALPDYRGAIDDLSDALEHGAPPIQVYYLRAGVYRRLGDKEAEARDRKAAAALAPADPRDYVVRGAARLGTGDAAGALADFAKAAEMNPFYLTAWQNQAHVLAEVLDQPAKALEAQQKAVECSPNFALARTGRAVLYARLGKRAEAHADAEAALLLSADAEVTYQAACVYALTAAKEPADGPRAVELFRQALRGYHDFRTIDADPDLKAIRSTPEFRDALAAAKALYK